MNRIGFGQWEAGFGFVSACQILPLNGELMNCTGSEDNTVDSVRKLMC